MIRASMAEVNTGPRSVLSGAPVYSLCQRLLGCVHYVGIDRNRAYVERARQRFGTPAEFMRADVTDPDLDLGRRFDVVLAIAILHHLDDQQAHRLLGNAARHLQDDGRLIALDCAIDPAQRRIARWLIDWDRGQNVRSGDGYRRLAEAWFDSVTLRMREDLLRVPYTHAIIECRGPQAALD
jgi:SAM-dependent methyltransferase